MPSYTKSVRRTVRGKMPSPEQIRKACEEIQRNWSPEERMRRAGIGPDGTFVSPELRFLDAVFANTCGEIKNGRAA